MLQLGEIETVLFVQKRKVIIMTTRLFPLHVKMTSPM